MKIGAATAFLCLALLAEGASGAYAQTPGETGSTVPGYAPLQYVPLYTPATDAPASFPDQTATQTPPASKPSPDDSSDVEKSPSFRAPTAVPRPDSGQPGFAPVVSALPDTRQPLVTEAGGVPRLYAPGFRLGPFDIRADTVVLGTYNDNIYLVPKNVPKTSDYIISLGASVEAYYENGTFADPDASQFSLVYNPTILEFLDNTGNSSLNQSLQASLSHRFTKTRISASQSYNHVSGGVIEGGDLVDQDNYTTNVDLGYDLTPKTSADLSADYGINRYTVGIGSNSLNSYFYLNYEARPKLTVSIAPYSNYLTTQGSSNDQIAVGGAARANYVYSDRTSIYAQFTGATRFYSDSSFTSQDWGYVLGASWQAGPKTSLNLSSSRSTSGSVISANSDYTSTSVGFSVSQGLVDRLSLSLSTSYSHADYFSTFNGTAQQTYDYFSLSPALTYRPAVWSDLGLSYTYRQNFSNVKGSEFTNNQVSVFSRIRF